MVEGTSGCLTQAEWGRDWREKDYRRLVRDGWRWVEILDFRFSIFDLGVKLKSAPEDEGIPFPLQTSLDTPALEI
jgi:hypothetical protein